MSITQEQLIQEIITLLKTQQVKFKNNNLVLGDGTSLPFPTGTSNNITRKSTITYR